MTLKVNVTEDTTQNAWIVIPEGDLDAFTSPLFQETVLSHLQKKMQNIIFDGTKLDYVDSTGLGAMIGIYKNLKDKDYSFILENINPTVKKLFHITELDQVFEIREGK